MASLVGVEQVKRFIIRMNLTSIHLPSYFEKLSPSTVVLAGRRDRTARTSRWRQPKFNQQPSTGFEVFVHHRGVWRNHRVLVHGADDRFPEILHHFFDFAVSRVRRTVQFQGIRIRRGKQSHLIKKCGNLCPLVPCHIVQVFGTSGMIFERHRLSLMTTPFMRVNLEIVQLFGFGDSSTSHASRYALVGSEMTDQISPETKLSQIIGTPVAVWAVFSLAVLSSMLLAKELVENLPSPTLRWPAYLVLSALALFNYVNTRNDFEWKFESWRQMRSLCLVCIPLVMLAVDIVVYQNQPIINIARIKFNCQPAPVFVSKEDQEFIKSFADGYSLNMGKQPIDGPISPNVDDDKPNFTFQIQKRKDFQDVVVFDCVIRVTKFEPRHIMGYRPPGAMPQSATFFYFDLQGKEGEYRPHTVEWPDSNGRRSISWGERFVSLDDNKWSKFIFVVNPLAPGIYDLSADIVISTDLRRNQTVSLGKNIKLVDIDTKLSWTTPTDDGMTVERHANMPLVLMNGNVEERPIGVHSLYLPRLQSVSDKETSRDETPNP
ncbi:hypothetical protein Plim_3962 [Planctopirus limnophila DSM 3776]|uniref:Uncharacterized protein n=2 Tax=Planctopirus limnophila TaxID=120 RepID=D5SXY0_PLAL2|nr:hypothetical protein Plim_3962 [Planctopirus limnophila DSM 3776]